MNTIELKKICEKFLTRCGWDSAKANIYVQSEYLPKILEECAINFFIKLPNDYTEAFIIREQLKHLRKYNKLKLEDEEKRSIDIDDIPFGCGEEDNI